MSNLKSGLVLAADEKLVMELEAELWAESANLIDKLIGSVKKFIGGLLGFNRHGFVVITDRRVVEVIQHKAFWVLNTGKNMKYVLPSSVKEIGYTKEGTCFGCFCQSYNLYYEAFTNRTNILLTSISTDEEAQKIVDSFYAAISN